MTRIALIALLAAAITAPALASGPLTVTASDRGAPSIHSAEAQRIFALLAAEGD